MKNNYKIGIIGLGYVGLPLTVEFGKKYSTIGYDVSSSRVQELINGIDRTGETSKLKIKSSLQLSFTTEITDLSCCNIFIVAVPTPIDDAKNPDLKILLSVSRSIGSILKKNDIVIFESTVYPGCTEEDCVPILEEASRLKYNKDFFCGYSPERINPGDRKNTLTNILKITSGSTKKTADIVDELYLSIIKAGTYKASSIKVAEAAKVIENCQRDINIAFVNELSIIFKHMNLDTNDILDAASTKWNFLPFKPGLVGGHCIGVDPYYLTYKAKKLGYNSKVILSGRELNDSMSSVISSNIIDYLSNEKMTFKKINCLILGLTFKEDCSDIRNSKVVDIYNELHNNNINIDVYDPFANKIEVENNYDIQLIDFNKIKDSYYHVIVVAVSHNQFKNLNLDKYSKSKRTLIYDIKNIYKNKNYMRL